MGFSQLFWRGDQPYHRKWYPLRFWLNTVMQASLTKLNFAWISFLARPDNSNYWKWPPLITWNCRFRKLILKLKRQLMLIWPWRKWITMPRKLWSFKFWWYRAWRCLRIAWAWGIIWKWRRLWVLAIVLIGLIIHWRNLGHSLTKEFQDKNYP